MIESFHCPISQQLMQEPVSSKYGHLYEKLEIERWVNKYHTCPMTNQPLEINELFPQYSVKAAIQEYKKLQARIEKGDIKLKGNENLLDTSLSESQVIRNLED